MKKQLAQIVRGKSIARCILPLIFIGAGVLDLTTGEASGAYSAILCAAGTR
jgi:hypothetical protein